MRTMILRYSTLAYRAILLSCSFAVLYLQNHYVPKETYERDKQAILASQMTMQQLLDRMEERNKVNDRQDETLKDHEARIRRLEMRRP